MDSRIDEAPLDIDWPFGRTAMDARIRAFDWKTTELGARSHWPPHLRATVEMMLAHGFPMILLWGERLIQIYNDGYAEIMQDKHPAGPGQPTSECWPEVWHINGPIYERVRRGETVTYEDKLYPLARPTGLQDTWFTITYSPVRDARGAIAGVLVTMFDTSAGQLAMRERDRKELALRESEQRLALLFKVLPVGVAIVDATGKTLACNDLMRTYLPSNRIPSKDDENAGRWRGWHGDGSPIQRKDFATARALRGDVVVPGIEFLFTHDDGDERWTQVASAPLRDADGAITGAFSMVIDIDDLKRNAERLRIKEERFRQFATASSDALWIRAADTLEMEFANPAFEAIYDLLPDQARGDIREWAARVVPDDRDAVLDRLKQVVSGESVTQDFRIQRPSDGAFRWIRSTEFPLFDQRGRVNRIAGIGTDVTDARRAGEHQQILLAELQHRVRNIMAMISSLVMRTRASAATADEYADVLSGRLMSLARTQALLTRAANAGVSIHTVVEDELAAQAHASSQYTLSGPKLRLAPKVTEVLSLAVHELATNALKYGALSRADGRVEVHWDLHEEAGCPWVGVRWQEFRQPPPDWTPPSRKGFGTMLIERRVPYELGGRGRLHIAPTGADALIEFPLEDKGSILETHAPFPTEIDGGANDMRTGPVLTGQRILVLDDDYYLAHDLAAALRSAGAEVIGPFSEAAPALVAIGELQPTAAVIDVNLGAGPSFEAAGLLRASALPFAFLTGYDASAIPAELSDAPILQKPADARRVVRTLATLTAPAD